MATVVDIDQKKFFTLSEAKELLPVVRRMTQTAELRVRELSQRHELLKAPEKKTLIEEDIRRCIAEWHGKILRLGMQSKGLWLVDFDSGDGFWCWQFPEVDISFCHGYHEGFRQRRELPEFPLPL